MKLGRAKVISFINLKGGVGKTTAAVNMAATIAYLGQRQAEENQRSVRVLLIDLDPQSNASLTLLRPEQYDPNQTIVNLFQHELKRNDTEKSFDLTTIRREKPIPDLNLDLIPSGLDLFDIQDELVKYHRYYLSATDILFNALNALREAREVYTHIIIDCPPSLGLVTLNGLAMSNYYIIPVFLDAYSHWGLGKIINVVDKLKHCKASCDLELLGVLYSRIDKNASSENSYWERKFLDWEKESEHHFRKLHKHFESIIFDARIYQRDVIRKAEALHQPLVAYKPKTTSDRDAQKEIVGEFGKLITESTKRMKVI